MMTTTLTLIPILQWQHIDELDAAFAFVPMERLNSSGCRETIMRRAHLEDVARCIRLPQSDALLSLILRTVQRELAALDLGISQFDVRRHRGNCPTCGGKHGRPRFTDPHGREGLHLSASHSEGVGIVALARRPVGIDVQSQLSVSQANLLESRLHLNERRYAGTCRSSSYAQRATQIWARKEAHGKAVGSGLCRHLAQDDLSAWNRVAGMHGIDIPAPPGFWASIAVNHQITITDAGGQS